MRAVFRLGRTPRDRNDVPEGTTLNDVGVTTRRWGLRSSNGRPLAGRHGRQVARRETSRRFGLCFADGVTDGS